MQPPTHRASLATFRLCALAFLLLFAPGASRAEQAWRAAEEGWRYEWPRDHMQHPDFKTEWWYFTGNLRTADGRRFGYEVTFFRQGLRTPGAQKVASRFVVNDIKLAHFAITDTAAGKFHSWQRLVRGAFGEAGYGDGVKDPRIAWNGNWTLTLEKDGSFRISAQEEGRGIVLHLVSAKAFATHGENGISRKAATPGHASHYYSATRLKTTGTLDMGNGAQAVAGESWFDHEWATSQLAPEQVGWDWFSMQFEDGSELMIYQLRRRDGTADPASSGTWIAADGTTRHLRREDIKLSASQWWTSAKSGGRYPTGWRVQVPSLALELAVSTPVQEQELTHPPVIYWEGLIDLSGTRAGQPVKGHGYLELTGYAGEVVGLSTSLEK